LRAYTENGHWKIENNPVKNALRPVGLGRINWFFLRHPDAAWRSAVTVESEVIPARPLLGGRDRCQALF
jgi:hypothetical protein